MTSLLSFTEDTIMNNLSTLSATAKRFALLDRRHLLNVVIIIALSIISFYTSFDGLSNYVSSGELGLSRSELVFLAVIVVIIQLLLIVALNNLSRHISWGGKMMWVVLYVIAMSVSVFFSYSFYYKLMQADNYAQMNFDAQLSNVLLKANIYQESFVDVHSSSKHLTVYSKETALLERRHGGTCGDNSSAGKGPRRDLREEEAMLFAQMGTDITLLSLKINQDVASLKRIKQSYSPENNTVAEVQQRMNEMIFRINRYRQGGVVNQAITDLRQHTGKARGKLWVQAREYTISCPDSKISRATKALLSSLKDLPVLEEIALFDSHDDKEVMERAMQVFLSIPTVLRKALLPFAYAGDEINSNKEGDNIQMKDELAISSGDYAPFLLGGLVDLIIFLVGFTNGAQSKQRGYLRPDYYGEIFSVKDIVKIEKAFGLTNLRQIFRAHLHNDKKGHTLVTPAEAYPEIPYSDGLIDLMESLVTSERIADPTGLRVPLDILPDHLQRRFEARFIGSSQQPVFNYYPISKQEWAELSQSLNAFDMLK
jgi:hypothetical protein